MSRPMFTFVSCSLVYVFMGAINFGWWALILGPLYGIVLMGFLAISPAVHEWVFGDKLYEIKERSKKR